MKLRPWQVRPTARQMGTLQRVLIGLLLVGAGLVALGVALLVDNQRFVAKAASARGQVVDVRTEVRSELRGSGDHERYVDVTYYYPIVQFLTAREQLVRFEGNDGSLRVGESVRVLYDPANPHDARLDSWPSRWGAGAVPIAVGLFLILVAVSALLYRQLRSARPGRTTEAPQAQHPSSARLPGGWRRRRVDHHGNQGPGGSAGPTPAR
jgi:Protein of unknown function (DUF3592)